MTNPRNRQPARRSRRREPRMALLAACVAAIALLVVFAPAEPTNRAYNIAADGTRTSAHQGLMISEVMADNASALPDENGNFPDWLEIVNTADTPLDLKGLTLSDRPDRARFIFPTHVLQPG
ncbi:MAG TPA: lamin tail domain-containing protein, partial [Candidatus Limnocylindria bacterium]|nr:lamin tail domain-containing protein [Candidatus Limnocylindria bacterium]